MSEYGIRVLLLQSFWTLLVYLCTVESSWQFLKELHHKAIIGLQLCPTYRGYPEAFSCSSFNFLALNIWWFLKSLKKKCLLSAYLGDSTPLRIWMEDGLGQTESCCICYYQLQWLMLWCHLSTKEFTFPDAKNSITWTQHCFLFSVTVQYLPFLTRFFERNVCFLKKNPLM